MVGQHNWGALVGVPDVVVTCRADEPMCSEQGPTYVGGKVLRSSNGYWIELAFTKQ